MHERSIEKIKRIIQELITNPELKDGPPFFDYKNAPFESISVELNKRKNGFDASDLTCKLIFLAVSDDFCRRKTLPNVNSVASEGEGVISELVEEVFDCYHSTPFEYIVEIQMKHLQLIHDTNDKPVVNLGVGQTLRLALVESYDEYTIFKIKQNGYYSGFYPESFMKNTLQSMNVVLFFLLVNQVITQKSSMYRSLSITSFMEDYIRGAPTSNIMVKNSGRPYLNRTVSVSLSLSKYLNELVLNSSVTGDYREEKTNESFETANLLLTNNSKEALRIRAAIDWLVQADMTDDETMSFIQICMGLESIFGDDDYEGSLTTILADRCAYLIGKNIKDRGEIKTLFRDIYKVRSKIVHGVRNHLSEKEEHLQYLARAFLSKSILKEIDNLELMSNGGEN